MELTANRQVNLAPTAPIQSQSSGNQDSSGKPFDPELLKDEKAALGVARELADSVQETAVRNDAVKPPVTSLTSTDSAEVTVHAGAPNWSNLSAQSKGYTFTERAINLYRHINAMAV